MMENAKADRPSEEAMWAGPSGERWLASANRFEDTIRPIGDALIARAALAQGENILDVGCGAGSMSLQMSELVGPGGSVTGLDISPALVNEGTRRAASRATKVPVRFVLGDAAQSTLPKGSIDCLVSRFGSMFFTDPYAAFAHMHTLIQSKGRIALACWAPMKQNLWMLEVRTILAAHFDLPTPPPRTPGPFAFDEPDYLRGILTKAGFKQIEIVPWQDEMYVGGKGSDPETATEFLCTALSVAQRALDAPEDVKKKVREQLTARLQNFLTADGVRMPASVWLATAQA